MDFLKNFGKQESETIRAYRNYRKVGMKLNDKIMESCLDQKAAKISAKLLGLLQGDRLVLEADEEGATLMDFMLHEYRMDGKTAIEKYREQAENLTEAEQDLIEARCSAHTSLFKITEIRKFGNKLILTDVLNQQENIELTDISFSQSASLGILLFFRLVSLKNLNMTSGSAFAFPQEAEKYLVKRYKTLAKRVKSDSESIQRFVAFFKLSRTEGINVQYR